MPKLCFCPIFLMGQVGCNYGLKSNFKARRNSIYLLKIQTNVFCGERIRHSDMSGDSNTERKKSECGRS